MILPNFFCIGVQKAGTTLLYEHLKNIEEIYLPDKKELHFFDTDDYQRGLEWYAHYFSKAHNQKAIGEITPAYIFMEDIAKKLAISPMREAKFIVILRHPADRAYSQYAMNYRRGQESLSFEESFGKEEQRILDGLESLRNYSYFKRGFYSLQIKNYFQYFNQQQFMFVLFEEFITAQDKTVADICLFLGVSKNLKIVSKKIHDSKLSLKNKINFMKLNKSSPLKIIDQGYPSINNSMKKKLERYYHSEILALEKIINKDLSLWL